MIGELPKLLDRNFVIGFLLPTILFAVAGFALLYALGLAPDADSLAILNTDSGAGNTAAELLLTLANTTIFALALYLFAALLLSVNRSLYRLAEGYGDKNPAHLWGRREETRYDKLQRDKEQATSEQEKLRLLREEAEQFPPRRSQLLPTRFGNTFRAFEYHSWWLYGIDAIEGWNRLVAVIPKEYQDLVAVAKAQTDFWLNLWFLGLCTTLFCLGDFGYVAFFDDSQCWQYLIPASVLLVLFTLWASRRARFAAVEYGNVIKAAFDVFLPALGRKLGFPPIASREQERDLWWLFAQTVTRRDI